MSQLNSTPYKKSFKHRKFQKVHRRTDDKKGNYSADITERLLT